MKTAILLGSVREGRQSHKIAFYLQTRLREKGITADLIDLAENPLPIMGIHQQPPPEVQRIGVRLQEADALLFVTPEYHGSFSGVLKNAIDYFWAEFQKKPIGVVTVSAGKMGGINASTQLQHVILSLGAFALPTKLLVPEVKTAFDDSFQPVNEGLIKSVNKFLDEYLWFADAVYQKKSVNKQIALGKSL